MASIDELDRTLPTYFTLSNKNLIVIARVREESVYFYEQLGPLTTVILLAEPECYALKHLFLEVMIELGVTVIDLKEKESFDENYQMTKNSLSIIKSLMTQYRFDKIITHPRYSNKNDSQNRTIFDVVSRIISILGYDNHYTYNSIGQYGAPKIPCGTKKGILELYCKATTENGKIDKKMLANYIDITANIDGIKKIYMPESETEFRAGMDGSES
jgi:hypothetical protein